LRGYALYKKRGEEVERFAPFSWCVPSCKGADTYTVDLTIGFCSCPDYRPRKVRHARCKHLYAAQIASAKRSARKGR
jgi:predicted nucleic acid-binding Zn finger protein